MNDLQFVAKLQVVIAKEGGFDELNALTHRESGSRELYLCKFRDAAIYLARTHTDLGVVRLGELFGDRRASAITAACQREELRLKRNLKRRDGKTHVQWHEHLLSLVIEDAPKPMPDEEDGSNA